MQKTAMERARHHFGELARALNEVAAAEGCHAWEIFAGGHAVDFDGFRGWGDWLTLQGVVYSRDPDYGHIKKRAVTIGHVRPEPIALQAAA